jgi:branched-chain amino acid transport system permease protein
MLVIGGMTSLFGAVVGTIVVSAFYEGLLRVEQLSNIRSLREIGLALVMIAVLVRKPHGITGGAEIDGNTLARWRDVFWAGTKAVRYRRARDLRGRDASRARQPR